MPHPVVETLAVDAEVARIYAAVRAGASVVTDDSHLSKIKRVASIACVPKE